jgi:hypothetical protein
MPSRPARAAPVSSAQLPPPGPADDHVDIAAAAAGAHEPRLPVKQGGLRAIAGGVLGGIRLDLVAAIPAPHDEPHAGRGGSAERHRRAGLRFHGDRSASDIYDEINCKRYRAKP